MRPVTLVPLVLGFLSSTTVLAQETDPTTPRTSRPQFFKKPVDLWKAGLKRTTLSPSIGPSELPLPSRESIWAEPIRMPDGRYSIYVPPKQVLEFLEDPTPKTLQAYLAWKKARADKLRRAMELLRQWKAAESAKKVPSTPLPVPVAPAVRPEPPALGRVETAPGLENAPPPLLTSTPEAKAPGNSVDLTYFHQHG